MQTMMPQTGISLRQVLPQANFLGQADVWVRRCRVDSRQVRPGDVFVAVRGSQFNGRDFIRDALQRGAAAIVTEQAEEAVGVPQCVVPHAGEAFGSLCQALAGGPSTGLKVIGVTGTNGKTTTTLFIASILESAGYAPGFLGTLGYCDRQTLAPSTHTTPPADVLSSWLTRMAENDCTHAVLEVSRHALSQGRVAGIDFDVACVTNVRHDHLDYHGDWASYHAAKGKLFDYLKPEGLAILNADDPGSAAYLNYCGHAALTVGLEQPAEITATVVERFLSEQTYLLHAGDETVPVRSRMIGSHNISNALQAAAVCLCYGIDLTDIARGLEDVKHVPGRLERIECGQPFGVFVDYAHTPDALALCLETLRPLTKGRLICVFGAGGDRDKTKRPLMGQAVSERADLAIVTNDNPRTEDPQAIIRDITQGMSGRPEIMLDRAQAIAFALQTARPGDCVLIAGKGHETYQIIGRETLPFDDRETARALLYHQPASRKAA